MHTYKCIHKLSFAVLINIMFAIPYIVLQGESWVKKLRKEDISNEILLNWESVADSKVSLLKTRP